MLFSLSLLAFLYWLTLSSFILINGRKIKYLRDIKELENTEKPNISIIIPVRNEELHLRDALRSVCEMDYKNLRIIVINDRSADKSSDILDQMKIEYENLEILNIEYLPDGWLGKNHALYSGFRITKDPYILFTDADVKFDKYVLNKSINYFIKNQLDHLTILPGIISPSTILKSVLTSFIIILTAIQRPWAARNKRSNASIGVGAFNLVKRDTYNKAGTHKAISMSADDDLKLAAMIKSYGGKSDVLYGIGQIELEWYASINEFIQGLMKNAFSGFKYNIYYVLSGVAALLLLFVIPLPLIFLFGNTIEKELIIGTMIFQFILYWKMPGNAGRWWYGFMSVYGGIILIYIILKASISNIRDGGIYWRDTFYSLKDLREQNKLFK